jgi:segregation and condensation protein A
VNQDEAPAPIPSPDPAREAIAIVLGQPVLEIPQDLYIPPDALELLLETFEGPMDLLLYLIKRQNLDILDIPIAQITDQYVRYIELMVELKLELAADYLVMAATLAEIKSRMLLPRAPDAEEDEDDPRAELVRRLQEYERFKRAAADIDELPRQDRDIHTVVIAFPDKHINRPPPVVKLEALLSAFRDVMRQAELFAHHQIQREPLSVRERMALILDMLKPQDFVLLTDLLRPEEGKAGVIVTFLALLQLLKDALIDLKQDEATGPIYVKAA